MVESRGGWRYSGTGDSQQAEGNFDDHRHRHGLAAGSQRGFEAPLNSQTKARIVEACVKLRISKRRWIETGCDDSTPCDAKPHFLVPPDQDVLLHVTSDGVARECWAGQAYSRTFWKRGDARRGTRPHPELKRVTHQRALSNDHLPRTSEYYPSTNHS